MGVGNRGDGIGNIASGDTGRLKGVGVKKWILEYTGRCRRVYAECQRLAYYRVFFSTK